MKSWGCDSRHSLFRRQAVRPQLHIAAVLDILRGKDARAAFAAEQYNTFVKYRQSVHDTRTTDYAADFTFNAIEKADINAVETSIKLNPLNINRNTEQFRFTRIAMLGVICGRKFWGGW